MEKIRFPMKGLMMVIVTVQSMIILFMACQIWRRKKQMELVLDEMVRREREKQKQEERTQEKRLK
jgi:hypothetical protein